MPYEKRIIYPRDGDNDEHQQIYALLCCFYMYKIYDENDNEAFFLEKLDKTLLERIKFYFPWVSSNKDIPEDITDSEYDVNDNSNAREIFDLIVNYGETEIEGEIIIPHDFKTNPFNGIWKTRTSEIIRLAHAMRYAELRLPPYYDLRIPRKNDNFIGVFASYFRDNVGYYEHYEYLPSVSYNNDMDSLSFGDEISFVEITLNGYNIKDINDLHYFDNFDNFESISDMDNNYDLNIWTDMSDINLYDVPEEYVW